jgi:hypothetical protein
MGEVYMDTRRIAGQFRLREWSEAVMERMEKGQTVKAFCAQLGITKSCYYYRQRAVREAACAALEQPRDRKPATAPAGWALLTPSAGTQPSLSAGTQPVLPAAALAEDAPSAGGRIVVEVGPCRIAVDASTDTRLLTRVCHALASPC